MSRIQRREASSVFRQGPFEIRRIRPGRIRSEGADPALGPLAAIDHANLGVGTIVSMHEHRNDEILSYLRRGLMVHQDSAGHRVSLSPERIMMMNAGRSFWHEETAPDSPVEMLQIFIRPSEADLDGRVNFLDLEAVEKTQGWRLIAGPEDSGAPLQIRNSVVVQDAFLPRGNSLPSPFQAGMVLWLYVMDGEAVISGQTLTKGDAITDLDGPLGDILAAADATLIAFLVDPKAPASTAGTISGH